MFKQKFLQLILVMVLYLVIFNSSIILASPPNQNKGPDGVDIQSSPTTAIQNDYIQAMNADGGRFIIGTTGGDPNTPNDNNKRLLYGYPTNVGSSFSTLRVNNGSTTTDYRLGSTTWDSIGVAPATPPTSNGTTLTTVWVQDGIQVEERLYFAQNSDTDRPDTTAIEYTLKNNNSSSRNVGLRMMLDTMIGGNDGAPFFILGVGQVTQQFQWSGTNIPNYWIAYESATFDSSSLKGRGQLFGGNAVRPDRFVIADWPQAFGTTWDYTVNPTDSVTNDSAVILYYNPVTLGSGQTKTYRTYYGIAKSGVATQLELTGLEVTQGIQNWENDKVAFIQDRPTFVRAHVRSTSGTVNDVTAELIGMRNGNALPGSPLRPANLGGNVDVLESQTGNEHRLSLNRSFYFELPASWRSGTVEFEFRGVNQTIVCKDHAGSDNDCKVQVTFNQSPAADVRFVGIIWEENGTEHGPTEANIHEVVQQIESTFPIPRLNWDHPSDIKPVFFAGPPKTILQFLRLNTMLNINRTLDGCISSLPFNCKRYYLGVVIDEPSDRDLNGMAAGIPADVVTAYLLDGFTHPHEFGHAANRHHTNCTGDEGGPDTNYPYSGGKISQDTSGDNAFFGFDIRTKNIYGPSSGDLMSYCRPRWPSDYTYNNIRNHLVSRYGASAATLSTPVIVQAGENAVIVSGMVSLNGNTGELGSIYSINSPTPIPAPPPGTYAIRFENSSGQPLSSYSFEPDVPSEGSTGVFTLLLPHNPNTTRIVLLHNGQVLDTRIASVNAPTVSVVYPNGGESLSGSTATLSWSASDPDGDTLQYSIQYSANGGVNWQTLVSDWPLTTYELNLDTIAGTNQGLLRVITTDGFHTTQDQSDGTFVVVKHSPQVNIQTPANNSLYVSDQTIILEGNAYDNEDGQLNDTALSWSSNLSGFLGNGHSLAINALTLAEGTHTITLTAQDSDNQSSSTSINIQIYRTPPIFPASLYVAPTGLSFTAPQGNEQSDFQYLSIDNNGDGTMSWSATTDQNWIRVSALVSTAPTDIIVAADTTGLAIGEYTGSITISAPGAVNSPQIIEVTLNVVAPSTSPEGSTTYLPIILK